MKYNIGDTVYWKGNSGTVKDYNSGKYYVEWGPAKLPMWFQEESLKETFEGFRDAKFFERRSPHVLIVDNFYNNPEEIRDLALNQNFQSNSKIYKGLRTKERFLFPFVREEFERLLNCQVTHWLEQPANGVFQITGWYDPLVWHSDLQSYAAAVYLTPNAPIGSGTSFWRDRKHGCRRPPNHVLERKNFQTDEERHSAIQDIYNEYNYIHPDNWELVDQVGAVFNRLVIWDAQLIHSASSYQGLGDHNNDKKAETSRLVQLFFFNVAPKT